MLFRLELRGIRGSGNSRLVVSDSANQSCAETNSGNANLAIRNSRFITQWLCLEKRIKKWIKVFGLLDRSENLAKYCGVDAEFHKCLRPRFSKDFRIRRGCSYGSKLLY